MSLLAEIDKGTVTLPTTLGNGPRFVFSEVLSSVLRRRGR